jgi:hypothetical protein
VVAGIRDRDLEVEAVRPTDQARLWCGDGGRLWLGWYRERVEIENYLVDPQVVARALGDRAPDEVAWLSELEAVARRLGMYTAARTALTQSRPRFRPLPNSWGIERGRLRHALPELRGLVDCRQEIRKIVGEYRASQSISAAHVLAQFDQRRGECRPEGARGQHFLVYFSGKDLLCALAPALERWGFASPYVFREAVLRGIEHAAEPWAWLPEWESLRIAVQTVSGNSGP